MEKYIKRFKEWMKVKSDLDNHNHQPPFFNEREIWWCYVGENVGVEISGKGDKFRRPVLVLRKLNPYSFIGLPLTKTIKSGSYYRTLYILGVERTVIISQIKHFDYRRLNKILTTITGLEHKILLDALIDLLISKN